LSGRKYGITLMLGQRVRLWYQRDSLDQKLLDGVVLQLLLQRSSDKIGAELSLGPSTTRVEYFDLNSNRVPRKQWTLSEAFRFKPWHGYSIGLSGSVNRLELVDTGEIRRMTRVSATLRGRFRRTGMISARVFARRESSDTRNQDDTGLAVDYKWRYGSWMPSVNFQWVDSGNSFADQTWNRWVLFFQAVRRFN